MLLGAIAIRSGLWAISPEVGVGELGLSAPPLQAPSRSADAARHAAEYRRIRDIDGNLTRGG
jgi:hypothetical protein